MAGEPIGFIGQQLMDTLMTATTATNAPIVFGYPWRNTVSLGDFPKGASQAIILGEKCRGDLDEWRTWEGSFVSGGGGCANQIRWGANPPQPDHLGGNDWPTYWFGGRHSLEANLCFADGSVKSIAWSIDKDLFVGMCKR
jgi:prepilin-type processing-associated H-X9-DG protein